MLSGYQGLKQHRAVLDQAKQLFLLQYALERLVKLYDATAKPNEAQKWRAELAAERERQKQK